MAIPRTIGPYDILRTLGTGGYGDVSLGRHRETGEEVAVKTVRAPLPRQLASLRHEIQQLRGLRHPGIVRILDHGVTPDGPWYAMERIEGTTLLQYIEGGDPERTAVRGSLESTARLDASRGASQARTELHARVDAGVAPPPRADPAPPLAPAPQAASAEARARIATIVRRLCGPLGYLHGEGIVHRDLKPENVVVRPDGWPVIVDFGLAARGPDETQRETIEAAGDISGTVLYMSPEQVRGELLDARTDLYALGCILYRLLTGASPFEAASPTELLMRHLHRSPEPPSRHCPDLDAGTESLVMRLLAKDPRERPGDARDVAAALEALGAGSEPLPGPEPRAYLYRASLAGRDAEMAVLDAALEELVRGGRGGLVLVGGDTGIGKTRVLKEAGRRALAAGARLLAEDCAPPAIGPTTLRGFRRLLQEAADLLGTSARHEARALVAGHAAVLAPHASGMRAVAERLELPEAAPLAGDAAQLRLFRSLEQLLAAVAARGPTVAMLDDLHEADELTLLALERMGRTGFLESRPLLLLASHRNDSGEPMELLRDARPRELQLPPLSPDQVAAIASDMLSLRPLPRPFAAFLAAASEGNPFFVAQYLRTAVATGLLLRDAGGAWRLRAAQGAAMEALDDALPLPPSLRDLATRKLSGISGAARRLLEQASIHGREVPADLARELAGLEEAELEPALLELEGKRILEEREGKLRFRHGSLQEVAYASLDPSTLPGLHRAAATGLASRGDAQPGAVARHWELAGEPRLALEGYRSAALRALERSALREAMVHYRACRRVDGTDLPSRLGLATVLRLLGRTAEAFEVQREAHALAVASGDPRELAASLNSLGVMHYVSGDEEEAMNVYESAVAVSRGAGDDGTHAKATSNLALIHWGRGRLGRALDCLRESLAVHRRLDSKRAETSVVLNLGGVLMEQGLTAEAVQVLESARALARETGDLETGALIEGNLASAHHVAGELALAEARMGRAVAVFREIGSRASEGQTMSTHASFLLDVGRPEEAHEAAAASRAIAEELGSARILGLSLVNLGRVTHALGRHDEARACLQRSLELTGDVAPFRQLEIHVHLSRLELDDGRPDAAGRHAERALELALGLEHQEAHGAARLALARHARATGLPTDRVRHHLDEAARRFEASENRPGILQCLCEQAQLAARDGAVEEARSLLARAEALGASFGMGERSPFARELAAAQEAVVRT